MDVLDFLQLGIILILVLIIFKYILMKKITSSSKKMKQMDENISKIMNYINSQKDHFSNENSMNTLFKKNGFFKTALRT